MDLVEAFEPVIAVRVDNLGQWHDCESDVLKLCQRALREYYKILVDKKEKTIYIQRKI